MAEFVHNINSGTIFKNDNKTNDNQPDYTGSINIEGNLMRIAGWIKTSRSGRKYLSLAVSESNQQNRSGNDDFDDDVPF